MEDQQIIELYWQRDESAIQATSERYGLYCYSVAYNILRSHEDAEESVNDTWLKTWQALPPQRPTVLKLFLAKITRNLAFDRYKQAKSAKRGRGEMAAVLDELNECVSSINIEADIQAHELKLVIDDFLLHQPARERDIFLRRYFYVEPVAGIARRYGLKESNVLMVLSRTRRRLKEFLQQGEYIYD